MKEVEGKGEGEGDGDGDGDGEEGVEQNVDFKIDNILLDHVILYVPGYNRKFILQLFGLWEHKIMLILES
jgi:hypothetical protein